MEALKNLNTEWQAQGHPFAESDDTGWTMICPSCSIAVGEGKMTLADALSRAIVHHQKCKTISARG